MTASTSTRHAPSAAAARRGLAIYLADVVVLSAPLAAGISSRAPSTHRQIRPLVVRAHAGPDGASAVDRVIGHEGFSDLGFARAAT